MGKVVIVIHADHQEKKTDALRKAIKAFTSNLPGYTNIEAGLMWEGPDGRQEDTAGVIVPAEPEHDEPATNPPMPGGSEPSGNQQGETTPSTKKPRARRKKDA